MRISPTLTFLLGLGLFGLSVWYANELANSATQVWQFLTIGWFVFNLVFWLTIYLTGTTFTDRLPESANRTWKNDIGADNPLSGCALFLLFYRKMLVILTDQKEEKNKEAKGDFSISLSRSIRASFYCCGWIAIVYVIVEVFTAIQGS